MNERKIIKKHHFSGSLAIRVLLVSLLLLVIPLFLQNIFSYINDYKQELAKAEQLMEILGEERVGLIDHLIEMDQAILDTVSRDISQHAKQLNIWEVPLPAGTADHFVEPSTRYDAFLVGKKNEAGKAFVIAIPFKKIIEQLVAEKDSPYPIRMSIVDQKGKVWAENIESRGIEGDRLIVQKQIRGTNWNLVLTVPKNLIRELELKVYIVDIILLLFLVGVVGGGAVTLLMRRISKPLNQLCKTMERVSEGALHARYIPDRMGFEINELGKQFNETLDAMQHHSQEAAKERLGRERLAEELKIGHDIQMNLLPQHVPDFPGLDIVPGYLPAKEVSGDYYDLFPMESGKLLICMADTAGKGISACLFSLGLRSMIRVLSRTTEDLSEIILKSNDLFWLDAHNTGVFVTMWLGIYDPESRTLIYCSQGHPPALLRRKGHITELWTGGIAMGAQQLEAVPTDQVVLEKDDLLLIYTDGVIEAHDIDDQLFGKTRLKEFLLRKKRGSSQHFADQLLEEIHLFAQGTPQHDDITFLVFRILG